MPEYGLEQDDCIRRTRLTQSLQKMTKIPRGHLDRHSLHNCVNFLLVHLMIYKQLKSELFGVIWSTTS